MLFLTALLLLAGCTTDTLMPETTDGRVPIGISVSNRNNVPTRAGTQIQKKQFDAGEIFNVYFASGADIGSTQFTTVNSLGETTVVEGSITPYFKRDATEAVLHAYYPQAASNYTTKFGVQQDQTTTENFKQSDLMYATDTITKSGKVVTAQLQFEHKFAKIVAMVTAGDSVQKIYSVRIVGGYRTVSLTDGTTCALGTKYEDPNSLSDYITMYDKAEGDTAVICAAMLPPQDINEEFIEVVTDNGNYLYTLTKELQGSHTYNIAFTVGATKKTATEETPKEESVIYNSEVLDIDPIDYEPTYTGKPFTPSVVVTDKNNGDVLVENTDYRLAYVNNINAGTATVVAVGMGSYLGQAVSTTFKIKKASAKISYSITSVGKSVIDSRFTNPLNNEGDGVVSYTSSNPAVATVSALTGKVEIKNAGTTIITATVADGENYTYTKRLDSYTITVTEFTIAGLKNWVNDDNTSTRFYGYYVDKDGNLHADYVAGDIGRVAYYAGYDVDSSISGSRILVLALNNAGNYVWGSTGVMRSIDSESGYSNTMRLQAYGSSLYPAAFAAWHYYADQPAGASNWFLPSTLQWTNMMVTAQMDGKGYVNFSQNHWTSCENDKNEAWALTAAGSMTNTAKATVLPVRPCFAY
jgi:hypothetical protein